MREEAGRMDDELFSEYQKARAKLEFLIEKTSRGEVLQLLAEDFDIEIEDSAEGTGRYLGWG
jgi:hypothetical protein